MKYNLKCTQLEDGLNYLKYPFKDNSESFYMLLSTGAPVVSIHAAHLQFETFLLYSART